MRTSPLLADFIHARICKLICEKFLTLPSNLKREELYRRKYRSENEFRTAVNQYIIFYNEQRPHAKNGYKTPLKKEQDYLSKQRLFESFSN